MNKFLKLIGLILLSGGMAYGIVPAITHAKLEQQNSDFVLPENIFFMHDYHLDYADCRVGLQQKSDLINAVKKLNAYVIGESTYDYQGTNPHLKNFFEKCYQEQVRLLENVSNTEKDHIKLFPPILSADFTKTCTQENIPCSNIECRQYKSLNNITKTAHQVAQEFYQIIEECQKEINDLEQFQHIQCVQNLITHCRNVLDKIKIAAKPHMDFFNDKHETLLELTKKYGIKREYFDIELLDIKIILELFKHRHEKNIIVFVGSLHADNTINFVSKYWNYHTNKYGIEYTDSDQVVLNNHIDIADYFENISEVRVDMGIAYNKMNTILLSIFLIILLIILEFLRRIFFRSRIFKFLFKTAFCLILGNSILAITPRITHLQYQAQPGSMQLPENIFFMHDFHVDYADCRISKKQKDQIIAAIKQIGGFAIGETTYDYKGTNAELAKFIEDVYQDNLQIIEEISHGTAQDKNEIVKYPAILSADFTRACDQNSVPCKNIECRQLIGGSLHNLDISADDIRKAFYRNIKQFELELAQVIQGHEQNPQVKAFVDYCNKVLQHMQQTAKPLMDSFENVQQTLDQLGVQDNPKKMEKILLFDLQLIDLKIVLEIFKQRDQKNIFVYVGNTHAKNVINFLTKSLAYKKNSYSEQKDLSGQEYQIILDNHLDIQKYFEKVVQINPTCVQKENVSFLQLHSFDAVLCFACMLVLIVLIAVVILVNKRYVHLYYRIK